MIALTDQPFDPGALLAAFAKDRRETGAIATFTGLARAEQGQTHVLELEAYPGFTEAAIGKIAPGEPVVFVATAARHRRAALEACDFLMDYLKSKAPFWKKEHGPDGARWVEPHDRDHADLARWTKEPSS